MKHNRVVSIIFAVLAAIVLVSSGFVQAETQATEWTVQLRPYTVYPISGYDTLYFCSGDCANIGTYERVQVYKAPGATYGHECLNLIRSRWSNFQFTTPASRWYTTFTREMCPGDYYEEDNSQPRYEYPTGAYYLLEVTANTSWMYTAKYQWLGSVPPENAFLPFITLDEMNGGGQGSRPIQPTATNPPVKGKKTPTPIPYP